MTTILPGESFVVEPTLNLTLGPGIYKDPKTQNVVVANAGILHSKINAKGTTQLAYVESKTKRYIPKTNDFVVGVVVGTIGEYYKVSLQTNSPNVLLPMMGFANVTKKNRPNLKIGQGVYARVSQDIAEIDVEIECMDATTGKDGGFGVLDASGYIFDITASFANELLFNANSIYLEKLSHVVKFEIAIGLNGKVWLKCGDGLQYDEHKNVTSESLRDMKKTLGAVKYLQSCENINKSQVDSVLAQYMKGTK